MAKKTGPVSGRYLLGIDIGTSSTKALLLSLTGKVVAESSQTYPLYSPQPGWNEQEPDDWWRATVKTVRKLVKQKKLKSDAIVGIGLSGQMHGSVFLDDANRPLRRALLWNDQRTVAQCEEITQKAGGRAGLLKLVNNQALTGYTAPKILWFRENEPKLFDRLIKVILPKDYVRFRLTQEHAMDVADASGTLLLDVRNRTWSRELLSRLEIDRALFPPLLESSDVAGTLTKDSAKLLGLAPGIPIVAGAGDQPAGAIGMGVVRAGIVSATIGTSGAVFAHSDTVVENPNGVLQSFCHAVPGKWSVFGCMLSAGGAFDWLSQTLYPKVSKNRFEVMTRVAQKARRGSDGLIFLPYLDGERCPHPDANARAAWIGLNRQHDLAAMTRATLEGITFGMADQILILRELGVAVREVRCAGGGAKSDFWLQLQSDNYNANTYTVDTPNAAAFGAALLAGVGAKVWDNIAQACEAAICIAGKRTPKRKASEFYQKQHAIYRGLYPALKTSFEKLAHLSSSARN